MEVCGMSYCEIKIYCNGYLLTVSLYSAWCVDILYNFLGTLDLSVIVEIELITNTSETASYRHNNIIYQTNCFPFSNLPSSVTIVTWEIAKFDPGLQWRIYNFGSYLLKFKWSDFICLPCKICRFLIKAVKTRIRLRASLLSN